ncbi:hypothetical protein CO037_02910, partial [Candidatus Pacearchaeota archaeon CG_4_9_14_0_2_um_filter_30_8]
MNKNIFILVIGIFLIVGALAPMVSAKNFNITSNGEDIFYVNGSSGNSWFGGNVTAVDDFCITSGNCLSSLTASSLGAVTGLGTSWYIPMWNGTTSLNNSAIYQSGTNVGIGTTAPVYRLDVAGNVN